MYSLLAILLTWSLYMYCIDTQLFMQVLSISVAKALEYYNDPATVETEIL